MGDWGGGVSRVRKVWLSVMVWQVEV
jgi:hypothetical protein